MRDNGFEGWYFKHQNKRNMVAFIPGRTKDGAFIQMISTNGSQQFNVSAFSAENGTIQADRCVFSRQGCTIDLPGVCGELTYDNLTPLRTDIMGPFRFFPMECRHGVISMSHTLRGSLTINGARCCFDGGEGYIETDSGTSFPSSYLWLQCNSFSEPCSVMASIAHIPFYGMHFKGCICAIIYRGQEYRLATYRGVRIHAAEAEHLRLSQGHLLLEVDIRPSSTSYPLRSPVHGVMSGTIHESNNAAIRVRLWAHGKQVFDLHSSYAAYEFVPPAPTN
ncbi:MAG: tocopherol cyclase family protein [Butyricicoccus sp.]